MALFIFVFLYAMYLEGVFHVYYYGMEAFSPFFTIGMNLFLAAGVSLICLNLRQKFIKPVLRGWYVIVLFILFVHSGYYHIFKQPLRLEAVRFGAGNALTNYWREALLGAFQTLPALLLYLCPLVAASVGQRAGMIHLRLASFRQKLFIALAMPVGILLCVVSLFSTGLAEITEGELFREFYDPDTLLERTGVLPMIVRDMAYGSYGASYVAREEETAENEEWPSENRKEADGDCATGESDIQETQTTGQGQTDEAQTAGQGQTDEAQKMETVRSDVQKEEEVGAPNLWKLDMEKLRSMSDGSKEQEWLLTYLEQEPGTKKNEYTGMFEGYNLIFLTAEGFCTYAIDEELTPTLYKLSHSGFVCSNYYVPLWQTSTSDGEFVNCTGLIPDGQFSMRKSSDKDMSGCMPAFFQKEGVKSRAYHDNSLTYYDRNLSHPNLGFDFKAAKLGGLSEKEWGSQIFPMEHPNEWPASDYEMMQGTIPEYINEDRFHVYYMTVSGHMNYNFKGNKMSSKNKEAVQDLDLSENARAYLACNIELDHALEYLINELEGAGKLENTVICLSADHYPYGMTDEQYEELAGKDLSQGMDKFRNTLILWNAAMTEPVEISKVCCSVDILPTLLNLFGFSYDSRLYAGRDILSDCEGMVIFNDRSFVSDTLEYSKKRKLMNWKKELSQEEQDAYLEEEKQILKDRYQFSAYVMRKDFYRNIMQCIEE